MTERYPGLIMRRFVKEHTPSCVEIQETWNVATPGCPILVVDLETGLVNKEIVTVVRNRLMNKHEWMHSVDGEQMQQEKI